jgi:hypothetical protein
MATKLEIAQGMVAAYLEAEGKVLNGQSYTISGRSLTRANLAEIRKGYTFWSGQVDRLTVAGVTGPTMRTVIPFG